MNFMENALYKCIIIIIITTTTTTTTTTTNTNNNDDKNNHNHNGRRGSLVINGARNREESSPCYHYFEVHGRQSVGRGDRGTRPPKKNSRVEDTIGHLSPLPKLLEVLYFVEWARLCKTVPQMLGKPLFVDYE